MSLIHHIDFIQHVLGVSIESVDATSFTLPGFEVEDEISITATLSGGGIATIFGSTSTRGRPPVHVQLWGDTGTILLQPDPMIYTERAIDGVVPGEWCSLPPDDGTDVRTVFIERFVAALAEGRPPDVPASDGLELQRVIEAAYRSIELGRPMTVREVA
jgi:predicted dehydrogenase